eukprot:936236-Prymnesium_polylepis.1
MENALAAPTRRAPNVSIGPAQDVCTKSGLNSVACAARRSMEAASSPLMSSSRTPCRFARSRSRPPVGSFRMLPVMFSLAPALVAIGRPTISMGAVPAIVMMGGKGFGGGEATRDPMPTAIDPNDPKGKQQAIHKAESFAEYLAKRNGASRSVAPPMMPAPLPGVTKDHEIYAWL